MQLTAVLAEGAEHAKELPADPIVFGVVAFVIFCALIMGLLMFGKGRPHA